MCACVCVFFHTCKWLHVCIFLQHLPEFVCCIMLYKIYKTERVHEDEHVHCALGVCVPVCERWTYARLWLRVALWKDHFLSCSLFSPPVVVLCSENRFDVALTHTHTHAHTHTHIQYGAHSHTLKHTLTCLRGRSYQIVDRRSKENMSSRLHTL